MDNEEILLLLISIINAGVFNIFRRGHSFVCKENKWSNCKSILSDGAKNQEVCDCCSSLIGIFCAADYWLII